MVQDKVLKLARHVPLVSLHKLHATILKIALLNEIYKISKTLF